MEINRIKWMNSLKTNIKLQQLIQCTVTECWLKLLSLQRTDLLLCKRTVAYMALLSFKRLLNVSFKRLAFVTPWCSTSGVCWRRPRQQLIQTVKQLLTVFQQIRKTIISSKESQPATLTPYRRRTLGRSRMKPHELSSNNFPVKMAATNLL